MVEEGGEGGYEVEVAKGVRVRLELGLTRGIFCPWFPNAIESAVVSGERIKRRDC